jgi:dihydrolipoamide dehydrogenase
VVLVKKERVGGTCLNVGCIPTKAPARRVTLVRGEASMIRPDALLVDDAAGGRQEVTANHVILTSGSITAEPPIPGRDLPGVVTSTGALDIDTVPPRLVVVAGGVIGLEFACIYEAMGSQVTVLEMAPSILPGGTDEVIAKRLQIILRRRRIAIQTGATVQRIEKAGGVLRVVTAGAGGEAVFEGERVLIATGRWPNTQAMGFEEIGLRMNGRAIAVDDCLATNLSNVWAIGDAVGGWMLAHKAMVEGRVAAENTTGGQRRIDYRSVPNVIFTQPEVASVGLTEARARNEGTDVKVSQFAFSANPKARILGECDGLVRLVCEAGTGRVLGTHLMGPHATDLVEETPCQSTSKQRLTSSFSGSPAIDFTVPTASGPSGSSPRGTGKYASGLGPANQLLSEVLKTCGSIRGMDVI